MDRLAGALQGFEPAPGKAGKLYSLPWLERQGLGEVSRLPVCLRVVLESLLRNCDGRRVRPDDVLALARWQPAAERTEEVPFIVSRVLLQDFTGVPLIVDLAAMRSAVERRGSDPKRIEPVVPVDLVIDHSVQVDSFGRRDSMQLNLEIEFRRNRPRYEFLKWGMSAFDGLRIVPPGIGICHQVNLEHLARGVLSRGGVWFPDSLVGTDSHTTMINGLGIVGWGVGGIEAEAGMLGQPVYFLMPDVVGVHVSGALGAGATATDLVLHVTEMLRKAKVVGKFVEFHGDGAATLPVPERATIANMAPEYGATMGFFPVDEHSLRYLEATGRPAALVEEVRRYYAAQGMFGMPRRGECRYTQVLELDLASVGPSVSGPKRPQDRIDLPDLKARFLDLLAAPAPNGYGRPRTEAGRRWPTTCGLREGGDGSHAGGGAQHPDTAPSLGPARNTNARTELEMMNNRPTPDAVAVADFPRADVQLGHGDVVIAAITSCTNTSNPGVMLAAGLLAKKAVERGLASKPYVKTSLAPGSRVVTEYLRKTGLQPFLEALGFHLVGYGCTTCIGNSGPLDPCIEQAIGEHDLVVASVLSGNRNFEARVHQSVKANFLMSPPLVVAFALAGRVDVDLATEPLGVGRGGEPVYLREIWPTPAELEAVLGAAVDPETYRRLYGELASAAPLWSKIPSPTGVTYRWDPASTYIREPPYFARFGPEPPGIGDIRGARALAMFGDSVTTDHVSPAGAITKDSPAGRYLIEQGVSLDEFNSYGARRGNHEVMVRGTFANVRIKNLLLRGAEGGLTVHQPSGRRLSIYDAAQAYAEEKVPLIVFAGQEYGTGSSRDWAAKGPQLLGVRVVVARSFERIHRSNLVFMGVLPCELPEGTSAGSLALDGSETFDVLGLAAGVEPRQTLELRIHRKDGSQEPVPVRARIDTPIEADYYAHGGILPYVLRRLLGR